MALDRADNNKFHELLKFIIMAISDMFMERRLLIFTLDWIE